MSTEFGLSYNQCVSSVKNDKIARTLCAPVHVVMAASELHNHPCIHWAFLDHTNTNF